MKIRNLLILLSLTSTWAIDDGTVYDTVIVGAGWAGLSTAKTLNSMGFTNFTILEARDRIGGRSFTSYEFGEDIPQDMGSYYLTSSEDNPLFDYLDETTITPVLQDPTPLVIKANGNIISEEEYIVKTEEYWVPFYGITDGEEENPLELYKSSYFYQQLNDTWNEVEDYQDDYYTTLLTADVPLRDVIDAYLDNVSVDVDAEDLSFFEMHVERWITSDYSGNTTDLSFLWFDESEFYNGNSFYVAQSQMRRERLERQRKQKMEKVSLKNGFKGLVDAYAAEVLDKIELSSKVTEINYEADPIEITYENEDASLTTIKADTVVVTVPVGVLRAGDINFIPSLDDGANYLDGNSSEYVKKEYALEHIGPGKIIHCALYWEDMDDDDIFWPNNSSFIQLIAPDPSTQGRFTQWVNFYHFNGGNPILMGTVNGDHVDDMVDMTDEEIMDEAVEKLTSIFGTIPEPTNYIVHNWQTDEFAKSAYSYNQEDFYYSRFYLSKSLPSPARDVENSRLHFAGEATSSGYYGLIQGAIWEGERAGEDVGKRLDWLMSQTPTQSPSQTASQTASQTPSETASQTPSETPSQQSGSNLLETIIAFLQALIDLLMEIFSF